MDGILCFMRRLSRVPSGLAAPNPPRGRGGWRGNLDVSTELFITEEKFAEIERSFGAPVATENLVAAAARIETGGGEHPTPAPVPSQKRMKTGATKREKTVGNVIFTSRFRHVRRSAA
jgi:hypothetical protein